MARKSAQKRTDGWVYVVQWKERSKEVKIGFSSDLKQRLNDFLTYSSDVLVVLKVFKGDKDKEAELHNHFASKRINGEWFRLDDAVRNYFKMVCQCDTKDARQEFGAFQRDRIIWRPLALEMTTRLQNAHQNTSLPRYIKNARTFTLWAIRDLIDNDFLCTPNAIITHPVNNAVGDDWTVKVLYDEKTIYNRISSLAKEGFIVKGEDKLYSLTEKGGNELDDLEMQELVRSDYRQSARPIYPRMSFDKKR
jgi:hypothetical protein